MSNEMMIFDGNEVEVFNFKGMILFNPKHVAKCLDIKNVNDNISRMNSKQVIKLKNSDIGKTDIRKLNNAGENFLTESGVYKLIFKSKKENAERFQDWVTDEVLPTIRKTGGYVNNDDLFINTYLPFADDTTKMLFKGTLETVRKQNELIQQQKETITVQAKEITHKEDVIIGLTKDIDLAEKRQRISQIVKHGSKKYAERYNLLYNEFNKKYHVDVDRRLENDKQRGNVKMSTNKMAYICDYMDMTNELYDLACKLFEGDFIQLLDEWKEIATREN